MSRAIRKSLAWMGYGRRPMVAAIIVGAVLRLYGLGRASLWYDEVVPMLLAQSRGVAALFDRLFQIEATRAPLHPLVLQVWLRLWGPSDVSGRALSVLFGVATVYLTYRIGRRIADRPTARWAAWLCAISPCLVYYSREIKMYAWLVMLTCLAWESLLALRRSAPFWRQAWYAVVAVALVYSHPLGTLMVAALAAAYLVGLRGFRLRVRDWLVIQVVIALACLPWLSHYLDHEPEFLPGRPSIRSLADWSVQFSGGATALLPIWLALVALGLWAVRGRSWDRRGMLLCWCCIPTALLYGFSLLRHPVVGPVRYVLFVAPAYLVMVAQGLAALKGGARRVVACVCIGAAAWTLCLKVYEPTFQFKHDWRKIASIIRNRDPRAEILLLKYYPKSWSDRIDHYGVTLRYYLGPSIPVRPVYRDSPPEASVPTSRALWLVDGACHQSPLRDEIARRYRAAGSKTLGEMRVTYYLAHPPEWRPTRSR